MQKSVFFRRLGLLTASVGTLSALSFGFAAGVRAETVFSDFTVPGLERPVHYFAPHAAEQGDACRTAVVIVHGWGDGVELPAEASRFAAAAERMFGTVPYVIAPVFPTQKTMAKFNLADDGRAHWCDSKVGRTDDMCSPTDDWRGGGDANGTRLSSFDVIDRLFALLGDKSKYPNLRRVVLAGFSAGGQFAGRYAAVGKGVVNADVCVEYAPMSPSTWLRLDENVTWLYGLKDRPRYAAGLSRADILKNLASRRQWNACGRNDVLKRPRTSLDSTPAAQAQGENRYDRFLKFRDYVKGFPDWDRQSTFRTFETLGHEYKRAYADPDFVTFCCLGDAAPVTGARSLFAPGEFRTGCNYWASNAGLYMWRRWDAKAVAQDIADLAANGVNVMRVFPLWPDFQPLTRLLGCNGVDRGVCQADGPLLNPAGVDPVMMGRFRFMCDEAEKHGVKLVVGLITGWMSGRLFAPPAFEGRNVLTDAETVAWEVRFVRHFVREFRDHPAIIGWDLGNECNCLAETDVWQSWCWLNTIASAIRGEDATRPVVSGMHGCKSLTTKPWNLDMQNELIDELTTHPYPLFTPGASTDRFDAMRSECHPVAESLYYWNLSGRHCFVEEAGDLGRCTASEERSAASMRTAMFGSWASGLGAYVWWCAYDQAGLGFPPYTWNAIERELGLFTRSRQVKPSLRELGAFRKFLDGLPREIAALPPRRTDATFLVPQKENGWLPGFAAYMLSKQAGFDIAYASAEKPLPDASFYILPAGTTYDTYSEQAWDAVLAKVRAGATLLLSKGNLTRYSGFEAATGVRIEWYRSGGRSGTFKLGGERPVAWSDTTTTSVSAQGAEVLAESNGEPILTAHALGRGKVVFVNFPIETDAAGRRDCFSGRNPNPQYLVYRKAAEIAGVKRRAACDVPYVGLTEHALGDGRTVVVAVNYDNDPVDCELTLDGKVEKTWRGTVADGRLRIAGNDAAVFVIR